MRDFREGLVGRVVDDYMIARFERRVHEGEHGFLRPGVDDDLIRLHALVERGDAAAERGVTGGVRVAQWKRAEMLGGARVELRELGHRPCFAVGRGHHVARREFPRVVVALEAKWSELHVWYRCRSGRCDVSQVTVMR